MNGNCNRLLVAAAMACACVCANAQTTFTNFNIGISSTYVFNDRIGNSRFFNGPNTDRVRLGAFVTPTPDTDAFDVSSGGLFYRSLNGASTSVSMTHPSLGTLTNPWSLTFVGATSGRGGNFDEFTTTFDRTDPSVAPLLDAWDAIPFTVTASNPTSPNGVTNVTQAAPDYDKNALPD